MNWKFGLQRARFRIMAPHGTSKYSGLWLIAMAIFTCCLIYHGSNSIRGTDQYWYLADVEALIDGNPPVTNAFFPGTLLRGEVGPGKPNYIYHNGPMIYFSALLGKYTGAYQAWILINLVCHFLVAVAIYLGASRLTSKVNARFVAALYLISPLALWQTMSMLLEQYLAGVMSLVVIGFFYRHLWSGRALFGAGVLLGTFSHPMFVALGVATGAYYVFAGASTKNYRVLGGGLLLVFCVFAVGQAVGNVFPSGFFPKLGIAVANVIPHQESMFWYFTDQGHSINGLVLFAKAKEAFVRQFLSPALYPFNLFTNLALLTWLWLAMFHRDEYVGLLVASGAVLALYAGLIVLMQHQARYQQLVSPVVFILLAVAIYKLSIFTRCVVGVCVFAGAIASGAYLSHLSHQKADLQNQALLMQKQGLDFVAADSKIVAYDCKCDQRLNYLLRPRPILNVKSRYLGEGPQARAIELFDPDYFVSNDTSLERKFEYLSLVESVDDPLHGRLHWYRVNQAGSDFSDQFSDIEDFR